MAKLVESMTQNEATDLPEVESVESDQPTDTNSVSLEDVLRTEDAAEESEKNKTGE